MNRSDDTSQYARRSPPYVVATICVAYAAVRTLISLATDVGALLHLIPLLIAALGLLFWLRAQRADGAPAGGVFGNRSLSLGALVFLSTALLMDLATQLLKISG